MEEKQIPHIVKRSMFKPQSFVGKQLICEHTKKMCLAKSKNCIKDCKTLLEEYYVFQEQMVDLSTFAEYHFCGKCPVNECKIFKSGKYIDCMKLVKAFMDGE